VKAESGCGVRSLVTAPPLGTQFERTCMNRFEINPNTLEPYVQEPRRVPEQSNATLAQAILDDPTRKSPPQSPAPPAKTATR
jgi:hypothetical protein